MKIRIFFYIVTFLKWIVYFLVTQEEREFYMMGKARGYRCIDKKKISFRTTEYYYDPNKEPVKDYVSFKEFFNDWKARKGIS